MLKVKMLENLLKTWETLAHDEFEIHWQGAYGILKNYDMGSDDEIRFIQRHVLSCELSSLDKAQLQYHIQHCIESRGWKWSLVFEASSSESFYEAIVRCSSDRSSLNFNKSAEIAILNAYIKALAAQRTITHGQWQHFKGEVVDVEVVAGHETGYLDEFIGIFDCAEKHELYFELYKTKFGAEYCISDSAFEACDRVFYYHNKKRWARKLEDFLGLVGAEHPENEGLLRFVKVMG
jgi:hypothetical protein